MTLEFCTFKRQLSASTQSSIFYTQVCHDFSKYLHGMSICISATGLYMTKAEKRVRVRWKSGIRDKIFHIYFFKVTIFDSRDCESRPYIITSNRIFSGQTHRPKRNQHTSINRHTRRFSTEIIHMAIN